jgi:predicted molibdopterin-dependent oxidoreductase YjgC
MCDNGRLNTFKNVNAGTRINGTYIRKEGRLQKVSWEEALKVASKSLKDYKGSETAFIGSPFSTCEDNFALVKFAKTLGVVNYGFMNHVTPGDQDDILIREDKTPNALGAELTGVKTASGGSGVEAIMKAVKEGKIKALYVMEDDVAAVSQEYENILSKLELLIVNSSNENKTTLLADILFPASSFAEKYGTFVNFKGRVQRIRPAVSTLEMDRALDGMEMSRWDKFGTEYDRWMQGTKFDANPSWKIFVMLSSYLDGKVKYGMAEDVFNDIARSVENFKGLDYDIIGAQGAQLKNINSESRLAGVRNI